MRVAEEATWGGALGAGAGGEERLPRGGEGAPVQVLHPEEVRGDAPLLAQVWQVLSFS